MIRFHDFVDIEVFFAKQNFRLDDFDINFEVDDFGRARRARSRILANLREEQNSLTPNNKSQYLSLQ